MTITEFLLARIAEDEALARRAGDARALKGNFGSGSWIEFADGSSIDFPERTLASMPVEHLAALENAARFRPARVLAECEAKRRIVERHPQGGGVEEWMPADWVEDMGDEERAGYCQWCTYDNRTVAYPCLDLRDLAAVYADHPDYDEAWRL